MKQVSLVPVIVFKHQIMPMPYKTKKVMLEEKEIITQHLDRCKYALTSMCFLVLRENEVNGSYLARLSVITLSC